MIKVKFNKNLSLIVVDTVFTGKMKGQELLLKLALDTGAAVTTVSYNFIEYLGYYPRKSPESELLVTGSEVEYAPIIKVKKVAIGDAFINNLKIYCLNFPPESYVDGVIGLNFLKHFNFSINYDTSEIILKKRKNNK